VDFYADVDWDEAFEYRPGQKVEFKAQPGTFDTIACYEPMMVPPIWLENDPIPRYPHQLRVVSTAVMDAHYLLEPSRSEISPEKCYS
jgi:hypothetical protein